MSMTHPTKVANFLACGKWQCRRSSVGNHLYEGWSHSWGRTWLVSVMFVHEWGPERRQLSLLVASLQLPGHNMC